MTAFLTPWDFASAKPVGKRSFRKRILPIGEIEYEGRRVQFDVPFLTTLVKSFKEQAYDQVPFQLATSDNKHNNDPQNFRGEVAAVDLADDGLYVTVTATEDGAKLINDNPKLGISARIVNGLKRADGKVFAAAMQHALATLDPMINGLGPWEAIEASRSEDRAINLTSFTFAEEEVPDKQPQLSDEELTRLRAILEQAGDLDATPEVEDVTDEGDVLDDDELTEEELNELIAQAELFEAEEGTGAEEAEIAASSDPAVVSALQLAAARQDETALELARVSEQLDLSHWEKERTFFSQEYGIPPAILDLAEPLLKGDGHVVELSNGTVADAGAVMRRVLTEIGQQIKLLDLSVELGTAYEAQAETEERDARQDLVRQYRDQTGI